MIGRFVERTAVVTGAGSGIGRAVVRRLVGEGASVVAVDLSAEALEETRTLSARPGSVTPFVADVGAGGTAAEAMRIAASIGRPDLLVGAAGVIDRADFFDADDEVWLRLLRVNVLGYASFAREFARVLRAEQRPGSVVLISSITAHRSMPQVPYSASKAAILGLIRSAAPELGRAGIRINSVSPGTILTGMNRDRLALDEQRARALAEIPLGRIGEPDDIASAVLFLLGDEAAYIHGTDLLVDGGFQHR